MLGGLKMTTKSKPKTKSFSEMTQTQIEHLIQSGYLIEQNIHDPQTASELEAELMEKTRRAEANKKTS